jgi:hypothetical protein
LRSARAAHWARAATSAQERSARSGKQGPRQCLEVWSCLPLRRMAESSAGDFTVGKIQKTRRQRVAKMYGQQKRNIIHTSSTAYEQDHSAAAHNPRARRPGGGSCCNLTSPGGSGIPRKGLASNRFSGERFTRWSSVTASSSRSRAARSSGSLPLDRAPL